MKFLVDESLSAHVARHLRGHGHDAIHAGDRDLLGAADTAVIEAAAAEEGGHLDRHTSENCSPSNDTPQRRPPPTAPHAPNDQATIVLAALSRIEDSLAAGAVITLTPDRARIRLLPV